MLDFIAQAGQMTWFVCDIYNVTPLLLVYFRLFKSHRPVVLPGRRLVRIDVTECEMPRGVEGFGAVYSKLACL